LKNYNLELSHLCNSATPVIAKDLLRFATNYNQIAERFGLQSILQWLRPIIVCLKERAFVSTRNVGSGL